MKKYAIYILTILLLFCFVGCSTNPDAPTLQKSKHTEYILDAKTCMTFFSCAPAEVERTLLISPMLQGHFVSAKANDEGKLVLILSDSDIQFWKSAIEQDFIQFKKNASDSECSIEFSEEYTSITSKVTEELAFAALWDITTSLPLCGVMQMLNGSDPNAWYVEVIMIDIETGKIVKQGRVPDDGRFGTTSEDWAYTRGETVE